MKCELENLSLYYEIYGEGTPILMIHGFELDHRVMKGCMEPIFEKKEGYQRIFFDLPGMGKTVGPKWIKNSDQMLEITLQFVEAIIPGKSFLVVGESYGAYLARGVIYKKFDFIGGACFICPLIIPEPSKRNLPEKIILVKNPELLSRLNPKDAEDFNYFSVVQTKEVCLGKRLSFLF
jgi:pimeloyl-ACP methyl ester carboxylesterase